MSFFSALSNDVPQTAKVFAKIHMAKCFRLNVSISEFPCPFPDPAWRAQVYDGGAPASGAERTGHRGLAGHHADPHLPLHCIQRKISMFHIRIRSDLELFGFKDPGLKLFLLDPDPLLFHLKHDNVQIRNKNFWSRKLAQNHSQRKQIITSWNMGFSCNW
jgi:hypothetical protein